MMVLAQARVDKELIIRAIAGEGDVRVHLESLGFVPGTKVRVVSSMGDNLIVVVRGSKIALDGRLASCIIV